MKRILTTAIIAFLCSLIQAQDRVFYSTDADPHPQHLWSTATDGSDLQLRHSFRTGSFWNTFVNHPNGNIYLLDASSGYHILYEANKTHNTFKMVHSFDVADPFGTGLRELELAECGTILGVDAISNTMFSFDPATGSYTQLQNFTGSYLQRDLQGRIIFFDADGLKRYNCSSNSFDLVASNPGSPWFIDQNMQGTLASDGKYYTFFPSGPGYIYSLDTLTNSVEFEAFMHSGNDDLQGNLVETDGGKFIGVYSTGGAFGFGGMLEFDPAADTIVFKTSFPKPLAFHHVISPYRNTNLFVHDDLMYFFLQNGAFQYNDLYAYNIGNDSLYQVLDHVKAGCADQAVNGIDYVLIDETKAYNEGVFHYDFNTGAISSVFDPTQINHGGLPLSFSPFTRSRLTGKYYTTSTGAGFDHSILYEYDPLNGALQYRLDFGACLELTEGGNGKIYGLDQNHNLIREYDPITNTKSVAVDLNALNLLVAYPGDPYWVINRIKSAANGMVYFSSYNNGSGTLAGIHSMDPVTHTVTPIYLNNEADNENSPFRLFDNGAGFLYCLAPDVGADFSGRLSKIDLSDNSYQVIYDFGPEFNGESLQEMAFLPDGSPIGVRCQGGGSFGSGAIYKITEPSNTLSYIYNIAPAYEAAYNDGILVHDANTLLIKNPNMFSNILVYKADLSTGMSTTVFETNGDTLLGLFSGLNALPVPDFTIQTMSDTIIKYESTYFTLTPPVTGPALTYQWYKNGVLLSGETGNAQSFTPLSLTDQGAYTLQVSNGPSTYLSSQIYLIVLPFSIVSQPQDSLHLCTDGSGNLSVGVTGTGFTYQWNHNGEAIQGATSSTLVINSAGVSDAGVYSCWILVGGDTVFSDSSIVTVVPYTFTVDAPISVCQGSTALINVNGMLASDAVLWSNGSNNDTAYYTINTDTLITLTIQNEACVFNDTLLITATGITGDTTYGYIFFGDSLLFAGVYLHVTGTYIDTLAAVGDCDSLSVFFLTVGFSGDQNQNGIKDPGEINGDQNNNGSIDFPEIAGDTNGNGTIDVGEVTGDTNGNGIIDDGELEGDANGNGVIDPSETTGLDDHALTNEIYMYPNPAGEQLFIIMPQNGELYDLAVFDLAGHIVYVQRSITGSVIVSLVHIINGTYFVQVSQVQGIRQKLKLVVVK